MPGNPHPAVQPYDTHDDTGIIALNREHIRLVVADANEVRNTDLSGQFAGIFVRTTGSNYALDLASTNADDGFDTIIDAAGNHFTRIATVTTEAQVERTITAAGDVTLPDDEPADVIAFNKTVSQATTVALPTAVGRGGKAITITDKKGDASGFPITIVAKAGSGQKIMTGTSYQLDQDGSSIRLRPYNDGSGWY